jgi:hypothetical protein
MMLMMKMVWWRHGSVPSGNGSEDDSDDDDSDSDEEEDISRRAENDRH